VLTVDMEDEGEKQRQIARKMTSKSGSEQAKKLDA